MASRPGKGDKRPSRRELLLANDEEEERPELALPFVEPGVAHLVDHLFDVGPSEAGEVLTYQEIRAWMDLTGHRLTGCECSTLRMLSSAYLEELMAASDPNRPSPSGAASRAAAAAAEALVLKMMAQYEAAPGQGPKPEADEQAPGGSSRGSAERASRPQRPLRAKSRPEG